MAEFNIAYEPVKQFEGGYDNDPDDRGGETYAGIARNFFPGWKGWAIVDAAKARVARSRLTIELSKNAELQAYVAEWYRVEWWTRLGLEVLPQDLANEIFEQSVNLGKAGCGKKLQLICNAYNYSKNTKQALFNDLVVDGAIGPKTRPRSAQSSPPTALIPQPSCMPSTACRARTTSSSPQRRPPSGSTPRAG